MSTRPWGASIDHTQLEQIPQRYPDYRRDPFVRIGSVGPEVFGELPGRVAVATVNDPREKQQIQVDVAVLAPEDTGKPRRLLSLGEVKWDRTMTVGHLDRLRRARELLATKGYDTGQTILACYSGAGFDENLRAAGTEPGSRPPSVDSPMLVDLTSVYSETE